MSLPEVQTPPQGRLPSPPPSPQSKRQHLYWHETILQWNESDKFRWTIIEYIPCLLGIIWEEETLGPVEQLTCFPPQAQYYFVKANEQASLSSLGLSYKSIFRQQESSPPPYRARHLRRYSEPDLPGPRYFDPNGITQTSWLFKKFLSQVLNYTTISCTCLILSLKFAQLYARRKRMTDAALQPEDNQFRVFVVSLMLANKYTEDHPYTSKAWATISGMPVHEINEMECDFLALFVHDLYISETEFRNWAVTLQRLCQWRLLPPAYIEKAHMDRRIKQRRVPEQHKSSSFWNRFKYWRK